MIRRFCTRYRIKYFLLFLLTIFVLDYFGVFTHIFELDYYKDFQYPVDGDVLKYARQIRGGQKPDVLPINFYNYTYLYEAKDKCMEDDRSISPKLVFIVKSALKHFKQRSAIRKSWGFEKRFSDVIIRTVFIVGIPSVTETIYDDEDNIHVQSLIDIESDTYHDVVQANFIDSYFNNTIKTMIGFRWAVKYCSRSKFYMFVDDDFYVSAKNVLRFVRDPVNYPEYLVEADETLRKLARRLTETELLNSSKLNGYGDEVLADLNVQEVKKILDKTHTNTIHNKNDLDKLKKFVHQHNLKKDNSYHRQLLDIELPNDVKLFAGLLFSSSPHRHKLSKWYVTLTEYPYHMWPPYVTAGAFILSREALLEMYYVSLYTKHFRFDDIFLGIVALKANIEPLHSEEFYYQKTLFLGTHSFHYVVASHGYSDPDEMVAIWSEQRAAGHA